MKLFPILRRILESNAADTAHKLGLTAHGWGYWADKSGRVVAQTVGGQLVKLNKKPDTTPDITEPELPSDSEKLVSKFVGHKRDSENDIGIMFHEPLEDAIRKNSPEIRALYGAFEPVREAIRKRFGDTILLFRAQAPLTGNESRREVLSWTSDRRVADSFAGAKPAVYKLMSPSADYNGDYEAIQDKLGRLPFSSDPEELEKLGQGLKQDFPDIRIDKWNDAEPGDAPVIAREIPVDDLVWYTNRANQREFIVLNRPLDK